VKRPTAKAPGPMANEYAQSATRRYGERRGVSAAVRAWVFSCIEGSYQQNANKHSDSGRERKKY